jgi:hypothetical protein
MLTPEQPLITAILRTICYLYVDNTFAACLEEILVIRTILEGHTLLR